MQINGLDLQDLTPEELAQALAEGNPMLVSSGASTVLHIEHIQGRVSISDSIIFSIVFQSRTCCCIKQF